MTLTGDMITQTRSYGPCHSPEKNAEYVSRFVVVYALGKCLCNSL